jgi:hypothetical protein
VAKFVQENPIEETAISEVPRHSRDLIARWLERSGVSGGVESGFCKFCGKPRTKFVRAGPIESIR